MYMIFPTSVYWILKYFSFELGNVYFHVNLTYFLSCSNTNAALNVSLVLKVFVMVSCVLVFHFYHLEV